MILCSEEKRRDLSREFELAFSRVKCVECRFFSCGSEYYCCFNHKDPVALSYENFGIHDVAHEGMRCTLFEPINPSEFPHYTKYKQLLQEWQNEEAKLIKGEPNETH